MEAPTLDAEGEVAVRVKSGGVPKVNEAEELWSRAPLDAVIVTV